MVATRIAEIAAVRRGVRLIAGIGRGDAVVTCEALARTIAAPVPPRVGVVVAPDVRSIDRHPVHVRGGRSRFAMMTLDAKLPSVDG